MNTTHTPGLAVNRDDEDEANARLIAAAPIGLKAAQESYEMLAGNPSPEAIETARAMLADFISTAPA